MIQALDRYVARIFLSSWLVSATLFLGLFGVVDFFTNVEDLLRNARATDGGPALLATFYLYQMPGMLLEVAPFVMLMAALFTVMRLQRHNEMMAMQLTGRPALRVLAPVFALTVMAVGGLTWVQEVLAPRLSLEREQLEAQLKEGETDWAIDVDIKDAASFVLNVRGFHPKTGLIDEFSASGTDAQGWNTRFEGQQCNWDEAAGGWRLRNGSRERRLLEGGSGAAPQRQSASLFVTDVRPEDLLVDHRQPFDLSYQEVLARSERYPQNPRYRLLRHYHVTRPLSVLLLVVLGVPFVLRRRPRSNMIGVGLAILLCVGYLIVDLIGRDLGNHGFLSPVLAAWLPVILAGSFGVVLFDMVDS
ncbi:MAG: LptF/LptG family permease [Planctomycetota bacterium]